jgi:hypothetical protein
VFELIISSICSVLDSSLISPRLVGYILAMDLYFGLIKVGPEKIAPNNMAITPTMRK